MQPFLTPDDAQAIDKYLAHITTIRSDIVTKPWLIDDMVILGFQHGVEFLTIIEISFPIHADATRNELRGVREVVRHRIPNLPSSTHHNLHETNHTFRFGAAHIAHVCPSATRRTKATLIRGCHCSVRLYFNGVRSRPSAARQPLSP